MQEHCFVLSAKHKISEWYKILIKCQSILNPLGKEMNFGWEGR